MEIVCNFKICYVHIMIYELYIVSIDFLQGECSEVHIHLSRVPIENVPNDKKEFEGWLMNRFSLKDK